MSATSPQNVTIPATSPQPVLRTNSLKLIRTQSERAQLSLARMVSHETAHVAHLQDHPEDTELDRDRAEERRASEATLVASPKTNEKGLKDTLEKSVEDAAGELAEAGMGAGQGPNDGIMERTPSIENDNDRDITDEKLDRDGKSNHDLEARGGPGEVEEDEETEGKKKPELQDQTNLLPVRQVIFVFAGLSSALFVSLLDQTIVSTALPTLGRVFSRAEIVSWVATSYLLTSTAVQPIYSRLSDIFGRKILLLVCLAIFSLGSLACALAQSMIQLIVFRAISGLGGGGILTLVMIVVSDVVTLKERGKYQGILGGVVACANSVGPVLGGVFTEKASWRWCFWINLPMTAVSILVVVFALPIKSVKGDIKSKLKKVDYGGSILTLAFSILILMALSWGGTQHPWDSAAVLAPLLIGVALLGVFLYVEWKLVPLPLIPIQIFRDRTVSGAMGATFLSGMVFYAQLYYLPQYFQVVRGDSAIRSGVLLLPLILVQTVTSFTSGVIVSKTGDYRINLYIGFAIWTIGCGLLSTIDSTTSTAKLCGYQVLSGIGGGQTFQTSLVAIQATVKRSEMAVATGARNFIRMLGGSVALAACAALLNNAVKKELKRANFDADYTNQIISDPTRINELNLTAEQKAIAIEGYTKGIKNIYYFLIPCVGISFLLVVFFVKHHSLKREDEAALKAEGKAWADKQKAKHKKGNKETPA